MVCGLAINYALHVTTCLNLMMLLSYTTCWLLDLDSYSILTTLMPFLFFLEFLYMVNLPARMLLLLSGLLKEVARMYPKIVHDYWPVIL